MIFYAWLFLAVVVVLMLAELSPGAVNAFLFLLLMGVILGRSEQMRSLIANVTNVPLGENK